MFTEKLSLVWGSKLLALNLQCLHPLPVDHQGTMTYFGIDTRIGHVTSVANGKWILIRVFGSACLVFLGLLSLH